MSDDLFYLNGYRPELKQQVRHLLENEKTGEYLLKKYPDCHTFNGSKSLYSFTMALKNTYLKSSPPISKVLYDDKIHVINNALGVHTFFSRVQGNKLKAKHEIRVSSLFRRAPESLLSISSIGPLFTFDACRE